MTLFYSKSYTISLTTSRKMTISSQRAFFPTDQMAFFAGTFFLFSYRRRGPNFRRKARKEKHSFGGCKCKTSLPHINVKPYLYMWTGDGSGGRAKKGGCVARRCQKTANALFRGRWLA